MVVLRHESDLRKISRDAVVLVKVGDKVVREGEV